MDETPKKAPKRWIWWAVGGTVVLAMLVASTWFLAGNKTWTDGAALRVADRETRIREVIWTRPQPVEGISADEQIYEPCVSPDGTELYFVRGKAGGQARIYVSRRQDNAWSKPSPVSAVNGSGFDSLGPRLTPDGRFLLFYSNRPGGFGGYDIWAAARIGRGWGKPFNLGPHVNSEFNEFNPDPTPDGKRLIFATNRMAARREQHEAWRSTIRETVSSDYDLWMAEADLSAPTADLSAPAMEQAAAQPVSDPFATTQPLHEPLPATQPDSPSPGTPGEGRGAGGPHPDSPPEYRGREGEFTPREASRDPNERSVGTRPTTQEPRVEPSAPPSLAFRPAHEITGINTPYSEGASCMSPAGDFLYFASNRPGGQGKFDIYRCRVHGDQFGPVENVGLPINSEENESDPAMAYNGFRMYFSSDRPGADGRYHLLFADSREVYSERQGHPLPHLGWSWWLLIISALVLVPLLMFLRGWEDHRLTTLQRCLLMSLLVHAVITFILSFVVVTQKVTQYVRQEMGMEVAVNLKEAQGVEESIAIRSQTSGDLPTSGGAPSSFQAPRKIASESLSAIAPAEVDVPGARLAPGAMTLAAAPAHVPPPVAPRTEQVAPNPAAPGAEVIDVKLPSPRAVRQNEAAPQAQAALAQVAKAAATELSPIAPAAVAIGAVATAGPSSSGLAAAMPAPAAHPDVIARGQSVKADVAPQIGAAGEVQVARANDPKLSGAERAAPSSAEAKVALARAGSDTAGAAPSAGQVSLEADVPRAAVVLGAGSTQAPPPAQANRQLAGMTSTDAPPSPVATGSQAAAPSVSVASVGSKQAAAEPAVRAGSADAKLAAAGPLQSASDRGAPSSGPSQVNVAPGPVATRGNPLDIPVEARQAPRTPNGRGGPEIGLGPSPQTIAASAIAGPQVAMSAIAGASVRARGSEPTLAPSGRGSPGPTTRPIETASASADPSGPTSVNVKSIPTPGAAAPASSALALGVSSARKIAADAVAGNPHPAALVGSHETGELNPAGPKPEARIAQLHAAGSPSGEAVSGPSPALAQRQTSATVQRAASPSPTDTGSLPAATNVAKSLASVPDPRTRQALATITGTADAPAPAAALADAADPQLGGPRMILLGGRGSARAAEKGPTVDAVASIVRPGRMSDAPDAPDGVEIRSAPVQAAHAESRKRSGEDLPDDVRLPRAQLAAVDIGPEVTLAPLAGALGPGQLLAPDSPFMRSPEQRKPLVEKLGGTRQSEDAVDRALAYLARMQEPDGRWTRVDDDGPPGRRQRGQHDMACTGFSVLAFLARNHTPDQPGPYRDTVARAIEYLIATQDENGDLRGQRHFRGGGPEAGNMYDHGIATYALAECAIMTHDPKTIDAALRGARFIVRAQNRETGGWRYLPGEQGDSSVFGWQIMALHSAEQIGFEIPEQTLDGAKRYIESCAEGQQGLLGGYQPHTGPTQAMTAELIFSRMLLGMPLSDDGMHEATRFLAQAPPDPNNADLYYWYYASLSMLHMQNPLWKDWNVLTRESLVRMQRQEGPGAGSWDQNVRWGDRAGRVFTTALATLTLEVYYRYLPIRANVEREQSASPAVR